MKKRFSCVFAAVLLLICLCACDGSNPVIPPSDPAAQVSFLVPDVLPTVKKDQTTVTATLKNNSQVEVRTTVEFLVYSEATAQSPLVGVGTIEETEDQLRAIEDTKRDMQSTKIMDR